MKITFLYIAILLAAVTGAALADERDLETVKTDFDGDGRADYVVVYDSSTAENADLLSLVVRFGNGTSIDNLNLIRRVGYQGSTGVSLQLLSNGSVKVTSVRDWGSSNWASDIFLSFRKGKLKVSGVDYDWFYRERGGHCEFNFLTGEAKAEKKKIPFARQDIDFSPTTSLDSFFDLCHKHTGAE